MTDAVATLTCFAPDEPDEAMRWIVVNGAEGGRAIWRGVVNVRLRTRCTPG